MRTHRHNLQLGERIENLCRLLIGADDRAHVARHVQHASLRKRRIFLGDVGGEIVCLGQFVFRHARRAHARFLVRTIDRDARRALSDRGSGARCLIGGEAAGGHLGAGANRPRRALKPSDLALGRRGDIHLLLHVAIERVGRASNAADLLRNRIEGAAGLVFAFDDGKRF